MRVSINSAIASLVVDLKEEQVMSLIKTALDLVSGDTITPVPKPIQVYNPASMVPPAPPTLKAIPKTVPVKTEQDAEKEEPKEYKGFLYLQCEECRTLKAFMPKNPISKYFCECGHQTALKDLVEMKVKCTKCGSSFKYMTNAMDSVISIDCLSCGAPVDLEYYEKDNEYKTIK